MNWWLDLEWSPFQKSSKIRRTPPITPLNPDIIKVQNNPEEIRLKTLEVGAGVRQSMEALRAQIREEQEREDALLESCLEEISSMRAAVKRQPNVNATIKKGLPRLEDFLLDIRSRRKTWRRLDEVLSVESRTRKRPGSSPPQLQKTAPEQVRKVEKRPEEELRAVEKRKESETKNEMLTGIDKEEEVTEWQRVGTKKKKKKDKLPQSSPTSRENTEKRKPLGARYSALSIKPGENMSYAQVLRSIKEKVQPEEAGAEIKSIRQTKDGQVLLELGRKTENPEQFGAVLTSILGDMASVRCLIPRTSVEIRDLDCLTDKEDVEQALKRDIAEIGEMRVTITPPDAREQRLAIVQLGEKAAAALLKQGRIKIGWVFCRIRQRVVVPRCFRCLDYGHVARTCDGPDRSGLCYKCGGAGHKAKECTAKECCLLCAEKSSEQETLAHASGSGRCRVFREALEKAKRRLR